MTFHEPMSDNPDCGLDAAAYVLGALEPDEAEEFRRHLEQCAVCRDEVGSLRHVVDALPMAAPQYPVPRGLRRRVLGLARRKPRQAPPSARASPARRRMGVPSLPALAGTLAAVIAAVVVAVLASGGSPGARVIQASTGNAELRITGGRGELIVHALPQPPAGQIYEVWLVHPNHPPAPTSALFGVTTAGQADVGVPGELNGVSEVLVTPEPAGGTRVPTHTPVIVARLD
ncbi:MAG: anti-sigma factor [Solirubrobacterales bacterium]|nr:anti-sigma factor [Solirubrobacterales bacterium]